MDATTFKELVVKRGLTYRYRWAAPADGKPTLLFLHGFPSSSSDWHKQLPYFQELGYGILAPDLLGAGGTDKPLDPQAFRLNAMARDIIDILAAEGVERVIGVAHDWGSVLLSRLSLLYPQAFLAYVWVGLCFMEPITAHFDLKAAMAHTKALLGYEGYSYWEFFLQENADRVVRDHVDSFIQLVYPEKPDDWLTYMVLPGKTAECIEGDLQLGRPSYLDDEEYAALRNEILTNGVNSSLNWYRAQIQDVDIEDSLKIPKQTWTLTAPCFQIMALKDGLCTPQRTRATMPKYASDVEYVEVDSGHWPHLERPDEVNGFLRRWLESRGW